MTTDKPIEDYLVKDQQLIPYQDLVDMVTRFQDQIQSLDYRVTNKNFGSKFYQTKETINSKARFIAGAADDVAILDAQHPTYRLWIGTEDPATAPFRVDKNGNATITSITLTGYIPTGGALTDIGAGNITGTYIDSGAITTPKLSATAIDGMTITGALVRTSSSGARVQMNDSTDALEVYDASVKRMTLDTDEITWFDSSGNNRGGIYASSTTTLYFHALNGGNIIIEAEGASYAVSFYNAGTQQGYFSASGLHLTNHLVFDGAYDITGVDDITMNSTSSILDMNSGNIDNLDELYFIENTGNPATAGQMHYYNSGGSQEFQCKAGTFVGSIDLTAT